jgi:hypothetical protein
VSRSFLLRPLVSASAGVIPPQPHSKRSREYASGTHLSALLLTPAVSLIFEVVHNEPKS